MTQGLEHQVEYFHVFLQHKDVKLKFDQGRGMDLFNFSNKNEVFIRVFDVF